MPYKDKKNRICGFLDVEEKEKSSKFVRRYLRLDDSIGLIEWFADNPSNLPSNAAPCGSIDVNYVTKVDIPQKVKLKAKYSFVVNTPMRRYYFQANDEEDMQEWVEMINNASKIVVSDEEPENTHNENVKNGVKPVHKQTEDFSYKTEIVAGVVIQKKVVYSEDNVPMTVKNEDSRSHSLVPSTPNLKDENDRQLSRTLKSGWAVKQGHVRKNWKRRYFILTTSGFSYYKSDHDREPIRYIPIPEILAAKVDDTSLAEQKDNLFFVATTDRIYYIQADSPHEMQNWVKSFNQAVTSTRSIKHRSKGSEPGGYFNDERKGSGASLIGSGDVPRRRKVENTLSLASPCQRNSTQVIVGKSRSNHTSSVTHSPVSYFRLSTTEDSFASFKSRSSKKRSSLRKSSHEKSRIESSSEESGGMSSSVDSLTAPLTEGKISNYTLTNSAAASKQKQYKRSCSGSELNSTIQDYVPPSTSFCKVKDKKEKKIQTGEKDENRHSFPSSKSVSVQVKPENLLPSSGSFSSPVKKTIILKPSLSSQSFSTNVHIRPSRSFLFDPKVDHRAAVKPSSVKKKRNPGILFSLNNMLNKKAEKMEKSSRKK